MKSILQENRIKFILKLLAIAGVVFLLLRVPQIRDVILKFGEYLLGRPFNYPQAWNDRLLKLSFYGLIASIGSIVIIGFLYPNVFRDFNKYIDRNFSPENHRFQVMTELQPVLLILFVFIVYLLKNILFLFNIVGHEYLILFIVIIIHCISVWLIYGKEKTKKELIVSIAISYGILLLTLFLSMAVYDYSYDGQAYHQPGVMKLRDGWNPLQGFLQPDNSLWRWVNHYPKFTEMYGSFFSAITNTIEAGKSYTILFYMISFSYTLRFISRYQKRGSIVFCLALIFTANPVVFGQMFTYYVDGVLGLCIILLVFSLLDFESTKKYRYLLMAIALSIFSINIKMTGFVAGLVLIAFLIRQICIKNFKNVFPLAIAGFIVLIVSVVFIGYNPYVLNFSTHGHPFWPLYGENAVDIINRNTPEYLVGKHPVEKFISLFLLEANWKNTPFSPLKLISIANHARYDFPIGGFGVFFIELWIGCLLMLFLSIRKTGISQFKSVLFPVFLLLGLVIITPENWRARYIPYFWYVPFFCILPVNISRFKTVCSCIIVIACINSGVFLSQNLLNGLVFTQSIHRFVKEVENTPHENITVIIYAEYFKYSVEEKLKAHGVNKNILFIEDKDAVSEYPFTHIKKWKVEP
ncbi:MAG: hypothetical protein Ta2A_08870 [Treponemataceae bacterium]|nr:MAG: hypothetical protein Ta2A_08870 [Treponemataceae bacterium]